MERYREQKILETIKYCKAFLCLGLCSIHSTILAETGRGQQVFDRLNDQFSTKSQVKDTFFGDFFLLVIAGAVLVFITWIAYQFVIFRNRTTSPGTPWGLYLKLCQVHNLTGKEQRVVGKVYRRNGLDDPLPLFVEPNYFKRVLADETMYRYHATVRNLLDKLFGSGREPSQQTIEADDRPSITLQEIHPGDALLEHQHARPEEPERVGTVTETHDHPVSESYAKPLEEAPSFTGTEKQSLPPTKVLLNPIPGRTAFSSLLEPFKQLTTEIAATSIRHHLADGHELNERTFDAVRETRQSHPEPQSPLFPKSHVPSPGEMLAEEARRTDSHSVVSPTPQYLRTHKVTIAGGYAKRPGEGLSPEDIAQLETLAAWK